VSYTCPNCGATSHNPADEEHEYCGRCHTYGADLRNEALLRLLEEDDAGQ
jgi:hypothetical protein